MSAASPIHGLMAEFLRPQEILEAARRARQAGYRAMDAYAPYPVEGLSVALGMTKSWIPSAVFAGGLIGAVVGFLMQYYSMAIDYPFNAGGRPYNSWPVFVPIVFEVMVLVASFSAFLGMLFLNGLPRPYHPVFDVPAFARASQDRFFLCIEAIDPKFDRQGTVEFLMTLPLHGDVIVVPQQELEEPGVGDAEAEPKLTVEPLEPAVHSGAD